MEHFAENYEIYLQQEQELHFKHFSNEDALELGLLFITRAKERGEAVAIDITVNGYQVFRYGMTGTRRNNSLWIERKKNTVHTMQASSIRCGAQLIREGKSLEEDWRLDPKQYAQLGGGFPIYLEGTGMIGSVCVSGLPHERDHQLIVDVLTEYLQKQ